MYFCYALYKSYFLALENLKEFNYGYMSHDISSLNYYHPIYTYVDLIPSLNPINMVYSKLVIILRLYLQCFS